MITSPILVRFDVTRGVATEHLFNGTKDLLNRTKHPVNHSELWLWRTTYGLGLYTQWMSTSVIEKRFVRIPQALRISPEPSDNQFSMNSHVNGCANEFASLTHFMRTIF